MHIMQKKLLVRKFQRFRKSPGLARWKQLVVRRPVVASFVSLVLLAGLVVGTQASWHAYQTNSESLATVSARKFHSVLTHALVMLRVKVENTDKTPPAAPAASNLSPTGTAAKSGSKGSSSGSSSNAASASGHFSTLSVGTSLPSDATCAAQVRSMPETRSSNNTANATKGVGGNAEFPRVTGNFAGSTDEILQWVACKWGIDEDIVRAQAAKESWWRHATYGDWSTDTSICAPEHKIPGADNPTDHPSECPESIGILQVRWQYHQSAFGPSNNALKSTAYNADYTYAVWRDCFEGNMTWLNGEEKGANYAAGDEWGCVGEWFSGRWLTPSTIPYIDAVKSYKNQRIWETPNFLAVN